ncbi:unnamed protein product [Heligmosomoides polygyrus]|uniref:Uncharacterized protein n=1 Tax=Heligmosomoides polygyrus TaxID=6339 RepID=A0A183FPH9_HELPZ|nr:unnamed protein product [Heligmosomoides polygyrus]
MGDICGSKATRSSRSAPANRDLEQKPHLQFSAKKSEAEETAEVVAPPKSRPRRRRPRRGFHPILKDAVMTHAGPVLLAVPSSVHRFIRLILLPLLDPLARSVPKSTRSSVEVAPAAIRAGTDLPSTYCRFTWNLRRS